MRLNPILERRESESIMIIPIETKVAMRMDIRRKCKRNRRRLIIFGQKQRTWI